MSEPNRRRESHRNGQKQAVSGFILTGSNAHFLSGGNTGMGVREFHFPTPDSAPTTFRPCQRVWVYRPANGKILGSRLPGGNRKPVTFHAG